MTYDLISPLTIGYKLYGITDYLWLLIPIGIIFYLLLFVFRMYLNLNIEDFKADIPRFFEITVIAVFLIYAVLFMFKITYISRLFIGYFAVYSFLSLILADYAGRKLVKSLKRSGYSMRNVVLVNGDPAGRVIGMNLKESIESQEYLGIRLIKEMEKGDLADLDDFVLNNMVDEVIFNVKSDEVEDIRDISLLLEEKGITVKIISNFIPFKYSKIAFEKIGGYPVISFYTAPEDEIRLFIKRLTDIFGSIIAMIIFFIPAVITAILIKLTSKGHVLYKSKRVGKNGRLFTFYKFRTMYVGSDELRAVLIEKYSKDGIEIKLKDDPRITMIGRFSRKTSMDEIPQLYNVLRGDMSLVGPRPPMPDEVKKYSIRQRRRISMKPGITCLWQVSGRSRLSFDDRVKLDLEYIDNWSLKLDFVILLKTVPAVLFTKGAL
ncbi:sugar transferase [Candidatus Acidulodesulfobacterium sp. H_13]|uniref:sugar transferase n=1 Tax=Candidatus Acidulodesulfobacterium sp. H_13 TaxID=3395470 RepID=UPI003AF61754